MLIQENESMTTCKERLSKTKLTDWLVNAIAQQRHNIPISVTSKHGAREQVFALLAVDLAVS